MHFLDFSGPHKKWAQMAPKGPGGFFPTTVWSLLRDPPVEIRRPFVRPQLQYHLPALSAGRDLKQPFVSHRSLLSGDDKQKILATSARLSSSQSEAVSIRIRSMMLPLGQTARSPRSSLKPRDPKEPFLGHRSRQICLFEITAGPLCGT